MKAHSNSVVALVRAALHYDKDNIPPAVLDLLNKALGHSRFLALGISLQANGGEPTPHAAAARSNKEGVKRAAASRQNKSVSNRSKSEAARGSVKVSQRKYDNIPQPMNPFALALISFVLAIREYHYVALKVMPVRNLWHILQEQAEWLVALQRDTKCTQSVN